MTEATSGQPEISHTSFFSSVAQTGSRGQHCGQKASKETNYSKLAPLIACSILLSLALSNLAQAVRATRISSPQIGAPGRQLGSVHVPEQRRSREVSKGWRQRQDTSQLRVPSVGKSFPVPQVLHLVQSPSGERPLLASDGPTLAESIVPAGNGQLVGSPELDNHIHGNQQLQRLHPSFASEHSSGLTHASRDTFHGSQASNNNSIHSEAHRKAALYHHNLHKLRRYLNERQRALVDEHPGSLMAVARALKMAIVECQYQMRNEAWDCPVHGFSMRPTEIFGKLMARSFKETSFVHSLISSAITHSIVKACSEQQIIGSCQTRRLKTNRGLYEEHLKFGHNFTRKFMEASYELAPNPALIAGISGRSVAFLDRGGSILSNSIHNQDGHHQQPMMAEVSQAVDQQSEPIESLSEDKLAREIKIRNLINAHNYELGRLHVQKGIKPRCKCHGLSGACTMHTCWEELPSFRDVAIKLHDSLYQAIKISPRVHNPMSSNTIRQKQLSSLSSGKKSNKKRSSTHPVNGLSRSSSSHSYPRTSAPFGSTNADNSSIGHNIRSRGAKRHTDLDNCENCHRLPVASNESNRSPATGTNSQIQAAALDGIGGNNSGRDLFNNPLSNTTNKVKKRPVARSIGASEAPTEYNLLYYDESPNFCIPNPFYNIKGTKGRICSEIITDNNSCKKLCCGRGYKTEVRDEEYKCDCEFKHCCRLECKTCTRRKAVHKCL